ncbi:MAG: DUF4159 domain-containing protein [Lentisphaeria bacterium]|nr:DUF4159 domain-containing protein [Victivallales bacterium]MBR6060309.1 DUF4159 domain-containing protein [Victivallales bacterium]MCR4575169.1 DUF4159 domain-containing protein [Lentisphaeria bacterium]
MKTFWTYLWLLALISGAFAEDVTAAVGDEIRVGQLVVGGGLHRSFYPNALPSLLRHIRKTTTANVSDDPVVLTSFADERLMSLPFVYVNFADRIDWTFTPEETENLRGYLERGGFLYVDSGITAAFLRERPELGQHHSYAEWEASPALQEAFKPVFPNLEFQTLRRSDELYRVFYAGLPDTSLLPDTVKSYTEQEKWPDGTYAAAVLRVKGRVAVLATPIVSMGWGKNSLGQWDSTIRFRVLEDTKGLSSYLETAAYGGARFEVAREDGGKDVIYCQEQAMPSWANEPGGRWRVFRYYGSREISDFAHTFYTQLGTNIVVYALTH